MLGSIFRRASRPNRRDLFYPPNGPAVVERAFLLEKDGSLAAQNPNVNVRWLLAHEGRRYSGTTPLFPLHFVMARLPVETPNKEWFLALRSDRELDESKLRRCGYHGDRRWGCGRLDILQQRRYHSVGDIGGQVHSLTYFLLLPVIICVPNRDLA